MHGVAIHTVGKDKQGYSGYTHALGEELLKYGSALALLVALAIVCIRV